MARTSKNNALYSQIAGSFLLSTPRLTQEPFCRAVIWITEFSERGAMGFVLSNPAGTTLGSQSVNFAGTPLQNVPLMLGGPVEPNRLTIVSTVENALNQQLMTHINVQEAVFDDLQFRQDAICLAFAGTAQWAPKQLEKELKEGIWIKGAADFVIARQFFREVELSSRFENKRDFRGVLWSRILSKQPNPYHKVAAQLPYDLRDLANN